LQRQRIDCVHAAGLAEMIRGARGWGWEDTFGLGDHDYNDLTAQLDFTSAHGQGWLMR
jgi:hypothetical protein